MMWNRLRYSVLLSSPFSTAILVLSQAITVLVHIQLYTSVQTRGVVLIFILMMAAAAIPAGGLLCAAYMRRLRLPFSLFVHLRTWFVYSASLNLLALFAATSISSIRTDSNSSTWFGLLGGGLCLSALALGAFSSWLSLDSPSIQVHKLD